MLEIFRMQLRQMLGGKKKWLVVLCLLLPVLLTAAASVAGGLGHLRRELAEEERIVAFGRGELPATAQRVAWQGEDKSFIGGHIKLTKDGLLMGDRPVRTRLVIVVNEGWIVIRDGELWIDPTKEGLRSGIHIRRTGRRDADTQSTHVVPRFETVCAIFLFLLYPQAISLLLALFYGTSVLGDELDGKTLTYLFVRPLPRWQFVVGKYLGIVVALIPPTMLSAVAAWLIAGSPGGSELLGGILAGTFAALLAYNALFVLIGFLIPRRAMIAALLYAAIFELTLSFVPALVNEFTVTYYLRSLVVAMLDIEIPREITRMVGGAPIPFAIATLGGICVGALALASLLASRREYVVKDTA
jgi:ABC-type transport system involved in multi-copper enzyme maturation permease subunit